MQSVLKDQDEALMGADGASLLAVNIDTGETETEIKLDTLPAWDGLAGANGRLFLSTTDGRLVCFGK